MRIILLSLFLSFAPHAIADRCDDFANETALEYKLKISELNEEFSKRLDETKAEYLKVRYDSKISFEMLADIWKREKEYDKHFERFTHQIYNVIVNLNNDERTRVYCDQQRDFEKLIDTRVDTYETLLNMTLTAISQRVELENIQPDEGLSIISAFSFGPAYNMTIVSDEISGAISTGPLNNSQYFRVKKLKKGKYQWNRVSSTNRPNGKGEYIYFNFYQDGFEFHVEPQRLNFAGVFIFEHFENVAKGNLYDRSAILVKILQEQYPYLLHRFEWHNALAPHDPFLKFYYSKKFGQEE